MPDPAPDPSNPGIILYQTEDGRTRIECRLEGETLWLSQALMAELFQTTPQNITIHLKALYEEGEIDERATCKEYLQVRREGSREVSRHVQHYSLPAIIAVGYRVRSHRGTQFRQWATARLSEFLVKGFTMDDERLKNPPGPGQRDYFEQLLERIRDIRSSERRFYQKILDIYATSVDYTPNTEASQRFFATVQNKVHWASHGHTAAEVIHQRADASKPMMGLKSTSRGIDSGAFRKDDVSIAKNYLNEEELNALNRIVSAYIEFAELQAMNRKPMTMNDWIVKLDDFLKLSGRELLDHAGKVSADDARAKAEQEYARYRKARDSMPRPVDADFDRVIKQLPNRPPDSSSDSTPPPMPTPKRKRRQQNED
jgi:hypothetical protein